MDFLTLGDMAYPVVRGTLSKLAGHAAAVDYCWCIEVHCGCTNEPPEPDLSGEEDLPWFAGSEPYLYAQMLPLRVTSPDELVGREYVFPQSPQDDPADWPSGIGWPFFVLYTWQHDLVYPMAIAFTEKRDGRYRVRIKGKCITGTNEYAIAVETWLDFE